MTSRDRVLALTTGGPGVLPYFREGSLGGPNGAQFHHLNAIYERMQGAQEPSVETPEQQRLRRDISDVEPLVVEAVNPIYGVEELPLGVRIGWEERYLPLSSNLDPQFTFFPPTDPGHHRESLNTPSAEYAIVLTPPWGRVEAMYHRDGVPRYVYTPAQTAIRATITGQFGADPNWTYEATSFDKVYRVPLATPIDRWNGIIYTQQPIGAPCLLLIKDFVRQDIDLVAFETPQFASCPLGFRASGGTVPLDTLIGL